MSAIVESSAAASVPTTPPATAESTTANHLLPPPTTTTTTQPLPHHPPPQRAASSSALDVLVAHNLLNHLLPHSQQQLHAHHPSAFHVHPVGSTSASASTVNTPIAQMERQLSGEPGMSIVVREAAQSFGEYYSRDPGSISLTCAHPALEPFALFVCRVVNIRLDSLLGRIIELAAELYLFRNDPDALRLVMEFWYHYKNFTESGIFPPETAAAPREQSVVEREIFHQRGVSGEKLVQLAIDGALLNGGNNNNNSKSPKSSGVSPTTNATQENSPASTSTSAATTISPSNNANNSNIQNGLYHNQKRDSQTSFVELNQNTNNNNVASPDNPPSTTSTLPISPSSPNVTARTMYINGSNNNNNLFTDDLLASSQFEIFLATQMGVLQSCIEAYFSADWHRQADVMVINKQHRDFMKKREWKKYIVEGYKQFREFCNAPVKTGLAAIAPTAKATNDEQPTEGNNNINNSGRIEAVEQMLHDLWNERNMVGNNFTHTSTGMGTATNSVASTTGGLPMTASSAMFPLYAAPSANFYPPPQHSHSLSASNLSAASSPSGFPVLVPLPEERSWLEFEVVNAAQLESILGDPHRTDAALIVFHAAFSTPSTIFVSSTLTAVRKEIEEKKLPVRILVVNASVEINLLLDFKVEEFPTVFLQVPPEPPAEKTTSTASTNGSSKVNQEEVKNSNNSLLDTSAFVVQRGETEVWEEGKQVHGIISNMSGLSAMASNNNNNNNNNINQQQSQLNHNTLSLLSESPSQRQQTFTAAPSLAETDSNGGCGDNDTLKEKKNAAQLHAGSVERTLTATVGETAVVHKKDDGHSQRDVHDDSPKKSIDAISSTRIMFPTNGVMNRNVLLEWITSHGKCAVPERKLKKFVTKLVRLDQRLRFAPFRKLHSAANTVRRLCTATQCGPLGKTDSAMSRGGSAENLDTATTPNHGDENLAATAKPIVIIPQKEPRFIFLGGGAASGKSTAVMALKTSPWWEENKSSIVVVDADEFKRHDPMYHGNTGDLHEKSVSAAEFLLVLAVNEGRHVVFDSTMMWAPFVEQTIAMVRDSFNNIYEKGPGWQGENLPEHYWQKKCPRSDEEKKTRIPYSIAVYGIFADPAKSVPRALVRELTSGRTMLVAVLLKSLKLFASNFEHYCELVDEAVLFDNNVFVDLEKGELPPTAAKKDFKGEPLEILDEASFRNFRRHKELNPRATKLDELYEGSTRNINSRSSSHVHHHQRDKSFGGVASIRSSGSSTPQSQD